MISNDTMISIGMRYYRSAKPTSRRTRATAITHSGSRQTVFDCICGSRHTAATAWRDKSVHVQIWRADHADCAIEWIPLGLA